MNINYFFPRLGLCMLVCFLYTLLPAKGNFQPGHITLNSGETLNGLIDYGAWRQSPAQITFKSSKSAPEQVFSPLDARGFGLSDELLFQSAIVQSESSPRTASHLQHLPELVLDVDTVFIEVILKGPKSLFRHQNSFGNENFYIIRDGNYEWLTYKKFLAQEENITFVTENKGYLRQLGEYLSGCPGVKGLLKETRYKQESLVELFKTWYDCQPLPPAFQLNNRGIKLHAGVFGGMIMTKVKFSDINSSRQLAEGVGPPSFNLTGGVYVDLAEAVFVPRWSLHNEFSWAVFEILHTKEGSDFSNIQEDHHTYVRHGYLRMTNMIRRHFPKGDQALFFNGGLTTGLVLVEENYQNRSAFGVADDVKIPVFQESSKMEIGIAAGLGYLFKGFGAELRYERGLGMSSALASQFTTQRIQFLVSFGI